jgi:hypothetical protein
MRPELSPEKIAEYEAYSWEGLKELPAFMHTRTLVEVGIAGCWLSDQLEALGASPEDREETGFAFGQICVGREPWACAQKVLDLWKAKQAPKPGAELADRLLMGDTSDLPEGGLRIEKA